MALSYRAPVAVAITLTGLASTPITTMAGRISAPVSNATNLDDEIVVSGRVRTSGATSASTTIQVWAIPQRADGSWPECFTTTYAGADAAVTVRAPEQLNANGVLLAAMTVDTTAVNTYAFRGAALSQRFGYVPKAFALFVFHTSAVALSATATDHYLEAMGVSLT